MSKGHYNHNLIAVKQYLDDQPTGTPIVPHKISDELGMGLVAVRCALLTLQELNLIELPFDTTKADNLLVNVRRLDEQERDYFYRELAKLRQEKEATTA